MKSFLVVFLLIFTITGFSQDKVKVRYKMSKNEVQINKVAWAKVEYLAGKYFLKTLGGEEFVSIKSMEYGTGEYFKNTGEEIMHSYCEVKFLTTDMDAFEVDANYFAATRLMYQLGVLTDDQFVLENAQKYKERYADNVSEKRFLTK
ncbi:MAG: hypothetical protein GQ574_13630 [Crocinitomix sp.]|nr:hypothetical protein [Crocinitomix sp.]